MPESERNLRENLQILGLELDLVEKILCVWKIIWVNLMNAIFYQDYYKYNLNKE